MTNKPAITYNEADDLMTLQDSDGFQLHIEPDIWQEMLYNGLDIKTDNLAKILWCVTHDHGCIDETSAGETILHVTDSVLHDLSTTVSGLSAMHDAKHFADYIGYARAGKPGLHKTGLPIEPPSSKIFAW